HPFNLSGTWSYHYENSHYSYDSSGDLHSVVKTGSDVPGAGKLIAYKPYDLSAQKEVANYLRNLVPVDLVLHPREAREQQKNIDRQCEEQAPLICDSPRIGVFFPEGPIGEGSIGGRPIPKSEPRSPSAVDGERLRRHLSKEAGQLPGIRSADDIFDTPSVLKGGVTPDQVRPFFVGRKGWVEEGLGKGRSEGKGWVIREYTSRGGKTGRMLRWHPGGGHHGEGAYWRVVGIEGDLGGIIR
ncbi:hypothetical protein, partial [Streptomyces malaysiense]|uniref:hypothetical protein n=1 Tax=Streptomyces malaysiense TaxID=1428626 RepID=UPI0019D1DA93